MSAPEPTGRRVGRPGGKKRLPALPEPISSEARLALQARIRQAATQKAAGAAAVARPAAGPADPATFESEPPPRVSAVQQLEAELSQQAPAQPTAQETSLAAGDEGPQRRKRPPPSLHLLPGSSPTAAASLTAWVGGAERPSLQRFSADVTAAEPTSSAPATLGRAAGRAGATRPGTPTRRAPNISALVGAPSEGVSFADDAVLQENAADAEPGSVPIKRSLSTGWSRFQNAAQPGDRAATPPRARLLRSENESPANPAAIASLFQEDMSAHSARDHITLLASVSNLSKIARTDKVRWGEVAEAYAIQVREYAEYKQAAKLEELEQHKRDAVADGSVRRSMNGLSFDDDAGLQDRYMQLRRALDQKELGVQLSTSGFPDEAEFRLQCCVAEFCEETGYHNRLAHLEGFESRKKRSRKLDLTLYFTENSIPGLVDPVPDEVEDAYVAYAHLATIRYKRAEEHQHQMIVWGSVDEHPGEEASERRQAGWERAQKLYRRDVDLAKEDLRAWISFLTETRREVDARKLQHKLPDKITIVLGSRLLILCARHGHIELAEGLYMVAVEWLDFGIHDVGVFGDSWTVKRLLQVEGRKKKCKNPQAYATLSERIPSLLRVTTVGGWQDSFKPTLTSRLRRYFVLALTLGSACTYYLDIYLDFKVLSEWYSAGDYGYFSISLFFIVAALLVSCLLDHYMATLEKTDGYDKQITRDAAPQRLRGTSMLPVQLKQFEIDLPPHPRRMWVRCILNVTFLRMMDEVYWAILAWSHGRIPAAAFDQVRSVEGLLEAIPQSLIVAYDLVRKYYLADLNMADDFFKLASWLMSMIMASMSLALLGQGVQMKWRLCFFVFCFAQLVLRVLSIMAVFILIEEHCDGPFSFDRNGDPLNQEMMSMWVQPVYCGAGSEWPNMTYRVVAFSYFFLSGIIGVVFHVVHLQGLSGGSLMACTRIGHKTEKEELEANPGKQSPLRRAMRCCIRLTIFNQKIVYTWIIGMLNWLIAFDCSPFSILKNAEPRPPRFPFAVFRAVEIGFACFWFEENLRKPTPTGRNYLFDFDAIAIILGATTLIFYFICLVVPHQQRDPLSKSVSRAVSVGLSRDQSGIYRVDLHAAKEQTKPPKSAASDLAGEGSFAGDRAQDAGKAKWETVLVYFMMALLVMMLAMLGWSKPTNKSIISSGDFCGGYCKNGGACLVDDSYTSTNRGSLNYFCHCTANFTGSQCEYPARSLMEGWEVMSGCEYTLAPGAAAGRMQPGLTLQASCANSTAEPAFSQLWHGGHLYRRLPEEAFNSTVCGPMMASRVIAGFGGG